MCKNAAEGVVHFGFKLAFSLRDTSPCPLPSPSCPKGLQSNTELNEMSTLHAITPILPRSSAPNQHPTAVATGALAPHKPLPPLKGPSFADNQCGVLELRNNMQLYIEN